MMQVFQHPRKQLIGGSLGFRDPDFLENRVSASAERERRAVRAYWREKNAHVATGFSSDEEDNFNFDNSISAGISSIGPSRLLKKSTPFRCTTYLPTYLLTHTLLSGARYQCSLLLTHSHLFTPTHSTHTHIPHILLTTHSFLTGYPPILTMLNSHNQCIQL